MILNALVGSLFMFPLQKSSPSPNELPNTCVLIFMMLQTFVRDYNWDWGSGCSHIFPHFKTNRDQESHRATLVSIPCSRNYLQFKSSEQEQEHIDYLKVNIIRLDNHLQGAGRSLNEGAIKQEWVVVTSKHHPCNLTISPNLPGYNCSIWSKVSYWAFFECTTWQLGATLPG